MAHINIKIGEEITTLYVDARLLKNIEEKIRPRVQKKDSDWVWLIDGSEGSGKSVLAQQLAKILDKDFDISRVCFNAKEFRDAVIKASKFQCIIFDEAFVGLSSKASLSESNKAIVELMMEMRQKNLYVIIVLPTFFMLEKYVAIFRSRGLFHVYLKGGNRGRWVYFNNKNKKELYIRGKKFLSYAEPKTKFIGRFLDKYTVDEKEYRHRKMQALKQKSRQTKAETFKQQRDTILMMLAKDFELSHQKISNKLKEYGVQLERKTISESIIEREKQIAYDRE